MSKRYNTPHRTRIIKTRVTEEEHADFMERLTAYGMSQSEFIRQARPGRAWAACPPPGLPHFFFELRRGGLRRGLYAGKSGTELSASGSIYRNHVPYECLLLGTL